MTIRIISLTLLFTSNLQAQTTERLDAGKFQVMDPSFTEIVNIHAGIEVLADHHEWTEGPLWIEDHGMLLYNDIPRNTIYKWTEEEGSEIYLTPSGFTGTDFTGAEPGANGLLLDDEGRLVMCQHGDRRMARMDASLTSPDANFVTLADRYNGKRFNSPNDATFRSNGDLFFTDPPYGLPRQMQDAEKEIPYQGVYMLNTKGKVSMLTDEFTRPNGIAFSPDEKTLYVANSDPEQAIWKVFDVTRSGKLKNGRILYDATENVPLLSGLPDGLKVNKNGIIFASGPGGIYVFDQDATLLGMIMTGQATSNCALNADESELFITADMYLLRVRLQPTN